MKKTKRIIILNCFVLLFLMLIPASLLPDALYLRLPVHINLPPGDTQFNPLNKENLFLFINGIRREINHIETRTRRIEKTSDLARHFVLSFHMDGFERKIMEGVKYFIDHILDRSDSLTVLTPLKSYPMKMSSGKAAVFDAIEELLKKDCNSYRLKRAILIKRLEKEIFQLQRLTWADAVYLNARAIIINFFNFSRQAIKDLKDHFLSPYSEYHQVANKLPLRGQGEAWWIHFQQRVFEPFPPRLKNIVNRWITYQNAGRSIISGGYKFKQLAKKMPISPEFPGPIFLEALLKKNICFNVICWGNIDYQNSNPLDNPQPEIEDIFETITRSSGGKTIITPLARQGLIELQQHVARFSYLAFPYNGIIESKNIHLVPANQQQPGSIPFSYPKQLEKDELQSLLKELSREKVRILNFDLKGYRVVFGVTAFHRNEPDIIGLLKIRAELYNEHEETRPVFKGVNTLHAKKEKIHISIPLPKSHKGRFKLRISVCDLIANQLDVLERRITL